MSPRQINGEPGRTGADAAAVPKRANALLHRLARVPALRAKHLGVGELREVAVNCPVVALHDRARGDDVPAVRDVRCREMRRAAGCDGPDAKDLLDAPAHEGHARRVAYQREAVRAHDGVNLSMRLLLRLRVRNE